MLGTAHGSWRSVDVVLLVLRVALGITFVLHGGQKLFNWFGVDPKGITGTTAFFDFLGIPAPHVFAYVVGLTEFLGGILLIGGLLTSVVAVALAVDMAVAIWTYNAGNGFFTETPNGGWELNGLILLAMGALALLGGGRWSLDSMLGLVGRDRTATAPAASPRFAASAESRATERV
jgi:putative oxidoreductase